MTIRAQILAGCLALTGLTGLLGGYAWMAERELGTLALRIYDDTFMGVSYLRSAQVGFAVLATRSDHDANPSAVDAVTSDLQVARQRAMSPAGRAAADHLIVSVAAAAETGGNAAGPRQGYADTLAEFERVVETFAGDGYLYRKNVGQLVAAQERHLALVLVLVLVGAVVITLVLSRLIVPPMRKAVRIAQEIAAGRLDNPIPISGSGETAELLRALAVMQASIAHALAQIRALMAAQADDHAGELAAQHAQLEAALDNMNQGLCLFGTDGRLAVSNRRFAEMFGMPALDAPVADVLQSAGLSLLLESTRDGAVAAMSCDLPDGRSIAVSQQLVQGGGWVATYEDVSERRIAEARLAHMARHDVLTGLPNRLLLSEYMPQALARARRSGGLAVLCLDLDRFKTVNDTLGHAAGDALLCAVTQRLGECTRESDMVIRLGGDEFAIVQESAGQPVEAELLARRLVECFSKPFEIHGHQTVIGTSIGIALSEGDRAGSEELLKRADMAMYRAKTEGRGTFRFFEPEMDAYLQTRRTLELDLRRALAEEQFELFYQPLVQVGSGGVSGFEALIRWRHPERGLVNPDIFITLAEEIGLIGAIGAWVLNRACADAATWPGALKVAVNLSPAQFRGRVLADDVAKALAASGLSADRLELEITESLLLQDNDAVLDTLHALRALGARISMDDFGTGYSSLSYLRRFPFDKIKIDQSFVRSMTDQGDCLAIVRAVIGLGRSLGIAVNAEGVETQEQFAALRAEGCGEMQGYLFSKPKPGSEVRAMLQLHSLGGTPRVQEGPSQDWGCDGGRVLPRPFSDRGWMRGLDVKVGEDRG